jgi:hypothetical protein
VIREKGKSKIPSAGCGLYLKPARNWTPLEIVLVPREKLLVAETFLSVYHTEEVGFLCAGDEHQRAHA